MHTYPSLKFKLNKKLDKDMCLNFLGVKAGGIDFGRSIVTLHPILKKLDTLNIEEKINFISDYVDRYYRRNGRILAKFATTFTLEWRSVEEQFYRAVNQIFPNYPWPEGLYICYLSIFNCNPRFLENKTFQVYYEHPLGVKHVASHEMLHFIFCDYLKKKFAKEIKSLSATDIWALSEVFNNIILATPDFLKLTLRRPFVYPEHVELTKELSRVWARTNQIELFLKKCFTLKNFQIGRIVS